MVDAITGLGTQPLEIDGWGLDIVIGGSQKVVHDSAGTRVHLGQPEGVGAGRNLNAAALLLQSEEGKEERGEPANPAGRRTRR